MPTAYTAPVQTGEITSLQQFAMLCARRFGACLDLRDADPATPIPEAFPASQYHAQRAAAARRRLQVLDAMGPAQAQAECQRDYSRKLAAWRARCDSRATSRARYAAMLEQVNAWVVPTGGHAEFRDFLLQQLQDSLVQDCGPVDWDAMPRMQRWAEWLDDQRDDAWGEYLTHRERQRKEDHRTTENNRWLAALRAAL